MANRQARSPQLDARPPAQELLDVLGPVKAFHDTTDLGAFGMPSGAMTEDMLAPAAEAGLATRFGPLEKVHAFWFAGMSCDGCSVAATGATNPSVESMMLGAHPGIPRVVLHHPVLNMESGPHYLRPAEQAIEGTLNAPYVVILEGSIADEVVAHAAGATGQRRGRSLGGQTASCARSARPSGLPAWHRTRRR